MSPREIDSNQLMTQAVSRRIESIQLMTQAASQGIDSESNHSSSGSPGNNSHRFMTQAAFQGINSESTHDSSGSPGTDSDRLMIKRKTFDSESTHDLTQSRTHVWCLVHPPADFSSAHKGNEPIFSVVRSPHPPQHTTPPPSQIGLERRTAAEYTPTDKENYDTLMVT